MCADLMATKGSLACRPGSRFGRRTKSCFSAIGPFRKRTAKARRITSESLSKRLPNLNPNDELGRLATVFNETLTRLEGSFAELQRFTADASHELRSPLTALRAVGEVALRNGHDPAMLRETIGSMLEE